PIGVVAIALSYVQLHESSDPEHARIDPVGLGTLTGGLLCLVLALIEGNRHGWSSALILGLFAAAAVLLALFVASQTREGPTMVDLSLFGRPAFAGAQFTAFAISASMFAMFLYLTLYLQAILALSPVATGVRFLPISLLSFVAAPIAGRLSSHAPIRLLLGVGLALNAIALWLMSGISPTDTWTTLLPGFIVGGIGIGMVNAPLASTAVSTVRQERAGMASGINNTFRQLGIATGIAALGAIFQSRVSAHVTSSLHGVAGAKQIARAVTNGDPQRAIGSVPGPMRQHVAMIAKASFISGLNDILIVGAIVAGVGAVLAAVLVRRKDFVESGRPADAKPAVAA